MARRTEPNIVVGGSPIDVDGVDDGPPPRRWLVGLFVLLAVGAVVLIALNIAASDSPNPQTGADTVLFKNIPLVDQVPGIEGTMHVVVRINRIDAYLNWPVEDRAAEFELLDTRRMVLNADQSQVAAIDFDRGGTNVRIGPPGEETAIAGDVTAMAWHDEDPHLIALTRTLNDTSLWVTEVDPEALYALVRIASVEAESEIAAFGAWGFALHGAPNNDGERQTLLFDADGQEIDRLDGLVAGSIPGENGGVLVADRVTGEAVATWTEGPALDTLISDQPILSALWSDDFEAYAQVSDGEEPNIDLLFVRHGDGDIYAFENYQPFAWDTSGRFLATVRTQQIIVIDAMTGDQYELQITPGIVSDIGFSD